MTPVFMLVLGVPCANLDPQQLQQAISTLEAYGHLEEARACAAHLPPKLRADTALHIDLVSAQLLVEAGRAAEVRPFLVELTGGCAPQMTSPPPAPDASTWDRRLVVGGGLGATAVALAAIAAALRTDGSGRLRHGLVATSGVLGLLSAGLVLTFTLDTPGSEARRP
jgi:hypothetical protein